MKRIYKICICLLFVFLLIVPFLRGVKTIDFKDIETIVEAEAKKIGCIQKGKRDFLSVYHMKDTEYEDLLYYGPSSYLDVQEIMILYAPFQTQAYEKILEHIESQKKSFEGYGVEQTELLSKAKVIQLKDYMICVVSSDETTYQKIRDLFR